MKSSVTGRQLIEELDVPPTTSLQVLTRQSRMSAPGAAEPLASGHRPGPVAVPGDAPRERTRFGGLGDGTDYEIRDLLAEGGSGFIWAARQSSLDRDVVIKTLKPKAKTQQAAPANNPDGAPAERSDDASGSGPDPEQMFRQEAFTLASLQHPNIVPVIELTDDTRGRAMLAMRRVRGVSWSVLLHSTSTDPEVQKRAQGMTLRDHLEILLKVCDAVAYAHHHGIIHRDLKPSQVMVGDFGEVVLIDWGLAMSLGGTTANATPDPDRPVGSPEPTRPRAPGRDAVAAIAGSPAYMAPEQTTGDVEALGKHTDVFLLGGILYEILTRQTPHSGGSCAEAFGQAMLCDVPPPSERTPDRAVPESLAAICMRSLHPEPGLRHRDASHFKRKVAGYLNYRVGEFVYSDAYWEVCRGEQSALSRPVLIKRVARPERAPASNAPEHPQWGGRKREIVQRMLTTESRVISRLWHPSIPTLYDMDQDDEGFPILILRPWPRPRWVDKIEPHPVTEGMRHLFAGPRQIAPAGVIEAPLDDWWPLARNLRVLWQVANAVEYAHNFGIIYRGIKPANIRVGDHGQVALVDWSMALQVKRLHDIEPIPSPPFNTIGLNPLYAPPECLLAEEAEQVSYTADVYGLGALLYHALTGCAPHWPWGRPKEEATLEAFREAALSGTIIDPREVATANRPVPDHAAVLAMNALKRNPTKRIKLRHFIMGLERANVLIE